MPRVTTGDTMAPCVVIGERAAEVLRKEHGCENLQHKRLSGSGPRVLIRGQRIPQPVGVSRRAGCR
jgi:choline dehydrogenase-like flavoprotein